MIADISSIEFPIIQSGRFQIVALLGSGGAGKVYKAIDTTLDKTVAIKTLHSNSATDALRFQREAKLAAVLKHPNVMQVYDFGFTQDEEPYLVLEYVEGQSLAERLETKQPIPLAVALKIFTQIAAGLYHAHSNNVIHRDIKPGNVLLVEGDNPLEIRALIVDFGLAKQQDHSQSLTAAGIGMGTPRYMSPEQFRGTEVDYRSDIYSFGCLMFQTLTGVAPFEADTLMQLLDQHLNTKPLSLSDTIHGLNKKRSGSRKDSDSSQPEFSDAIEAIVSKCLQKSADDRYQSAEQLRLDLLDEFQKELARSSKVEVRNEEELNPPKIWTGPQQNQSGLTTRYIKITVVVAVICTIVVSLWMLLRASSNQSIRDVPLDSRSDDTRILHNVSKLPVSAVYLSKTGMTNCYAENDQQLKDNLKGLHAKRIELSNSNFTPQGFRDAETSEATQIESIGNKLERAHLEAFAELKHLQKLGIGGPEEKFNSDDLSVLSDCKELRQLALQQQKLTTADFNNIVKLTRIEELDLSACEGITADNLLLLKKLPNLDSLVLDNTSVSDKEIHAICSLKLKNLGLKECNNLTIKCFDELGRMKSLQRLSIRGTSYPMEYILAFRRHNQKVTPNRGQVVKPRMFDYTELPPNFH